MKSLCTELLSPKQPRETMNVGPVHKETTQLDQLCLTTNIQWSSLIQHKLFTCQHILVEKEKHLEN